MALVWCDTMALQTTKGLIGIPIQTVFKRYELKYLLTAQQKQAVLDAMKGHMELDQYGRTSIRNIYFDTENYRLIRRSIEKPAYKEKLRLRSYRQASADSTVFVELKKKYNSIVYKRRLSLPEKEATQWVTGKAPLSTEQPDRPGSGLFSVLLRFPASGGVSVL